MNASLWLMSAAVGAASSVNAANAAALIVAAGTFLAGAVAYLRLRQDRPKVVEEAAGIGEKRIRDELLTAWEAVDRLRHREDELEVELESCHDRIQALELENGDQATRIRTLERIIADNGLTAF